MKKRTIFSLALLFAFASLFITKTILAYKKKNAREQQSAVALTKPKPKVDLHTAVVTNNLEAVKEHIAAGSDLNIKDPIGGSSPLISASLFGKTEIAKALIDAGADVNFKNNDGSTALHVAAFFCHPEIVQMLLAKSADKTVKNKYSSTAYESVAGPFASVKGAYDGLGKILGPMGLKLDYAYIEKERPEIAAMLK